MSTIEDLGNAIDRAIDDCDVGEILTLLTGVFVGLTVELARRHGADTDKQITIDGGKSRDITIHAPKNGENHG